MQPLLWLIRLPRRDRQWDCALEHEKRETHPYGRRPSAAGQLRGPVSSFQCRHGPLGHLITGSIHIAEEVTHDSYIAIQQRWDSIDSPRAYLRQAVVNRSRLYLRELRTQRNAPVETPQPSFPEEIDETWRLVQQLPDRRRTALVLRYHVDLPVGEIAKLMNTRPGTVKSLLHRGRETLRKQLR